MSLAFDPYYTWLAIPPEDQPPHHYRLLGVKPLEENLDVIETAADRQMLHLRTYQSGKHSELSQKILNEVSTAKVTLLTPAKKSAYDAELRAKLNAVKQAEAKKIREERPLATAKPLQTAAPLAAQPARPTPAVHIAAPQASMKPRAPNNIVPLIVIGVVALVLLAVGGVAAMMFLGNEEPTVAVNTNPDGVSPIVAPPTENPATDTLAPPVVPPVIPPTRTNDKPPRETPATSEEPPAIDEPDSPTTTDLTPPIDEEPIDEEPVDDEETLAVAEDEPAEEAPKKLPVPDKAEREAKRKDILAIFPLAQAKTFEQKGELAAQLISTAGETVDDPAAVFAMLNLAREQAAEAGHIKLAFEATDMLGETFDFDAAAVRIASLQQASRAQLPPAAKRDIVIAGMDVIDELSAADKFDEADTLSDRILALARPLRDAELIKILADQRRAFTELAASFKKAQAALETLKASPDDDDANLAAGKYLAFVKQDWDAGLAHLAKGSDAALAAAAKAELAAPTTPADQEKLADKWWSAAEGQKDAATKDMCRAQAASIYREIVDQLGGLAKVKVEKRIEEAKDVVSTIRGQSPRGKRELEAVYVTELQEIDSRVGHDALEKRGGEASISVLGQPWHCGIQTHAVRDGTAYVNYDLNGEAVDFETIALLRSNAHGTLVFRVVGDDRVLWQSPPMQANNSAVPCRISVRNVRHLSMQVLCKGSHDQGHAWWINPRISRYKVEATQSEPDLGIFSRDPAELATPQGESVYLDDLPELESKVGRGALGKRGQDHDGKPITFQREQPEHSLFMYGSEKASSFAKYKLDGKFDTLEVIAGLADSTSPQTSFANSHVTFVVVGDGKELWKSPPFQKLGEGAPFTLSIRGVNELTLRADCAGDAYDTRAAWINPRLTRLTPKSSNPKPIRRTDLQPRQVVAVAAGSNNHTVFVNGQKLLDCGRDKATTAACILKPGDVITVRLGDRFDIKSFWMLVLSDKGEPLFETSENWIGYLPADDARWWDVSTKGLKQEPAQFTGDGREYVGHVQGAAAAALPTLRSKDKAQPIFSPLHGGDNRAFLAYVVTVDDLKPKKANGR